MKISGLQRKENIINNIEYLIKSRGETKASFANRTGVTRATLYKILEGKVSNVQHSTIIRIADFFGVSCEIIENSDLRHIELIEKTLSPEGDKNPAAIPVVPQTEFISRLENRIGYLVTQYPLTWYFGEVSNVIALRVEKNIGNTFRVGDMLIIKRKTPPKKKQLALFFSEEKGFFFRLNSDSVSYMTLAGELLIGTVVEERVI
ncbi:MAG: helix-turn-helix domain-containing protein [Enterobacterales bacterium endosymbiont of Blomia tropicalis]|uniref:helix-turn-helix domain-containing protein n=1 Tax=Mixta mediterraneensis TaxID=2758443 RepID=UPI0025A827BE|nr:helix-turn-helix domain-containing protein [Mixta mediterraneensis]MDL4912672.1 helix-turn-helix domain-containing protein [Mixta mediterraneensis]